MKKGKSQKTSNAQSVAAVNPTTALVDGKKPSKVWTGMLTFGVISMPVCLMTAATQERISFNQLHKECKGRIKQQLHCPACDVVVPRDELLKGYEHRKGEYIVLSETELSNAEPKSAKVLDLSSFVPAPQLDPIYLESSYYLAPEAGGEKPYALVREAMRRAKLVGVVRIVRSNTEHICIVRPYGEGMILHTLYWPNEVRGMAFPALPAISEAEIGMAEQLVKMLTADWNPKQYKDSYREAVLQLIAAKLDGKEIVASPSPAAESNIVDIASALQRSIELAKGNLGVA